VDIERLTPEKRRFFDYDYDYDNDNDNDGNNDEELCALFNLFLTRLLR